MNENAQRGCINTVPSRECTSRNTNHRGASRFASSLISAALAFVYSSSSSNR